MNKKSPVPSEETYPQRQERKRLWMQIFVVSAAVVCLAAGCLRGELPVVLGKAVTVCLECIGLG